MNTSSVIQLGHGVVLDPDGWAARLGRALRDARCARDASVRALARESGGRFTARDLRLYEKGLRPVGDRLSPLLADLYEVELGEIAPPDTSLEVDLDALVVRAGGATRAFDPDGDVARSALAAYLDLVWAMRGGRRTHVSLRRGDVEVLGSVLALDEERIVEQLAELMQVSRDDARRLLVQLRRRPLVPVALAALVGVTAGLTLVNGGSEVGAPGLGVSASPQAPASGARAPSVDTSRLASVVVVPLHALPGAAASAADEAPVTGSENGVPGKAGQRDPGDVVNGHPYHDAGAAGAPAASTADAGGAAAGADGAAAGTGDAGSTSGDVPEAGGSSAGTSDPSGRAASGGGSGPSAGPGADQGEGTSGDPTDDASAALPTAEQEATDLSSDGPSSGDALEPDASTGDPEGSSAPEGDQPAGDPTAGDSSAGDEPAGDQSAGDELAGDSSAGDQLPGDPSSDDQPAGETPAGDQPAGDPAGGDPLAGDPSESGPSAGDPSRGDPAASDPPQGDPPAGDPSAGDPSAGDPSASDPSAGDPSAGSQPSGDPAPTGSPTGDPSPSASPPGDPPASGSPSGSQPSGDPAPTTPSSGTPTSGGKGNNGKSEYAPGQGGDGWGAGTSKK